MLIAVWVLGLLMLALWSVSMWAVHAAWTLLAGIPWQEALARLKELSLPALLEPWFGGAWQQWLEAIGPVLAWTLSLLQGSAGWITEAVPVLLWIVWGVGAVLLVGATAAGLAGVWWWRKRQQAAGAA